LIVNLSSLLIFSFAKILFLANFFIEISLLIGFIFTDLIIGFHGVTLFTWGSVILIGLGSRFFAKGIFNRISGSLLGACLFFIITNFGVWISGTMYTMDLNGLITCFLMAIPFYKGTLLSFMCYSAFLFGALEFSKYKLQTIKNHL